MCGEHLLFRVEFGRPFDLFAIGQHCSKTTVPNFFVNVGFFVALVPEP